MLKAGMPQLPPNVRLRLSHQTGLEGAPPGVGVFAAGAQRGRTVFKCGDYITKNISGLGAMRTQSSNGMLCDWAVDGNSFAGLETDRCVIWSGVNVPLSITREGRKIVQKVELGCKPNDFSLYLNHSFNPNVEVGVSYDTKLEKPGTCMKYLSTNPVSFETCSYYVMALKDIKAGEEMFWSYHTAPDFSGTSYRTVFELQRDGDLAKKCIAGLTGSTVEKLVAFKEFHLLESHSVAKKLSPGKRQYLYSRKETVIKNQLFQRYTTRTDLKNELLKCRNEKEKQTVYQVYLKVRLEGDQDLTEVLESIRTVFSRISKYIPLPHSTTGCGLADIYEYCYEHGLITPEEDPSSVPYEWLAKKIRTSSGNNTQRWHSLLQQLLRSILVYPNAQKQMIIRNLTAYKMPNPLRRGRAEWNEFDLTLLAGLSMGQGNDGYEKTKLIKRYSKKTSSRQGRDCKQVATIARRGDIDAIKAMILRRLKKTSCNELITELKKSRIKLIIKGKNCIPTQKNLFKFIREHYTQDERCTMKGTWWCDDDELVDFLNNKGNALATQWNSEICSRIRKGRKNLIRPYIKSRIRSGRVLLCHLLKSLKDAHIYSKNGQPFDRKSLLEILSPGEVASIPTNQKCLSIEKGRIRNMRRSRKH